MRPRARGPEITFRQAEPADLPAVTGLYAGLSPRATELRFSSALSGEALRAVVGWSDGDGTVVFLALTEDRVVGEARYSAAGDAVPEMALVVADDARRLGVGRHLLDALRHHAREIGIPALRAVVRVDNRPMLQLLRSFGTALTNAATDSELVAEIATDDDLPGWPAGSEGRRVLVESGALWDDPSATLLREAGFTVRRCLGPARGRDQTCPIVLTGRCRLVDGADILACLLPDADPSCHEVAQAHVDHRPSRLTASTMGEWQAAATQLIQGRPVHGRAMRSDAKLAQ